MMMMEEMMIMVVVMMQILWSDCSSLLHRDREVIFCVSCFYLLLCTFEALKATLMSSLGERI